MKDNFSGHASDYARYRPTYPQALYRYLFPLTEGRQNAWDCGTGNGQVAVELASVFDHVWATDLSNNQLKQAPQKENIRYEVHRAEESFDENNTFDLITVAQAIHWFDFDAFYKNVHRVLKPNGIFAAIGYAILRTEGNLNSTLQKFYKEITDPYWDPERKYLDDAYTTIPFPFVEEVTPRLTIQVYWTQNDLLNYLNTWSAVKHYEKANGSNPLDLIKDEVSKKWGTVDKKQFVFPLILRVGRLR